MSPGVCRSGAAGLTLALGVALSGCASGGPTGEEVLTSGLKPETARLVIYRSAVIGMGVQPDYMVGGQKVGSSQAKGFIVCDFAPGPREVKTGNPGMNVNFGGGSDAVQVNLQKGTTTYLRAEPKMGLTIGVITLTEVDAAQGKIESAALFKTASACTPSEQNQARIAENKAERETRKLPGFD
jgi:hypothetical protein